jgi:hypothetical protein
MTRAARRRLVLLVVAAACLPYLSTINDYFMQDDFGVVQLLTARPWHTFPRWFTMPWMEDIWGYTPDEIRPFVAFTYQLTGKWAPARPELHHIFNIAMHAANAVLVMALGRVAVGLSPAAAAFAGILFAVLPVQAESVAWITGRVDSMPAFFYLATLLCYVRWRQSGRRSDYGWALACFFVALFSKQTAITMGATLAAYDLLIPGRDADAGGKRVSLKGALAAWTPFVVMTAGYLLLRRVQFGHSVRGGVHGRHELETFAAIVGRHFQRVTLGHTVPVSDLEIVVGVLLLALAAWAVWRQPPLLRRFLCFCLAWWAIAVAPILVAGYESPRHVYLASAAWVFFLAIVADALFARLAKSWVRTAAACATLALAGTYLVRLHFVLQDWHALARISKLAVERVRQEALAAPEGTLLLVGLPTKSWEWGVPFVLRPPYQPADLTGKVRLVTPWRLYCCGAEQWDVYARRQLQAWVDAPNHPPVVALYFARPEGRAYSSPAGTGAVSRLTDADYPELRTLVPVFLQTDTPETLDGAIVNLLERVVKK